MVYSGQERHMCQGRGVIRCAVQGQEEEEGGAVLGFDSGLVFGNLDKSNFNKAMNMDAYLE